MQAFSIYKRLIYAQRDRMKLILIVFFLVLIRPIVDLFVGAQ